MEKEKKMKNYRVDERGNDEWAKRETDGPGPSVRCGAEKWKE